MYEYTNIYISSKGRRPREDVNKAQKCQKALLTVAKKICHKEIRSASILTQSTAAAKRGVLLTCKQLASERKSLGQTEREIAHFTWNEGTSYRSTLQLHSRIHIPIFIHTITIISVVICGVIFIVMQ